MGNGSSSEVSGNLVPYKFISIDDSESSTEDSSVELELRGVYVSTVLIKKYLDGDTTIRSMIIKEVFKELPTNPLSVKDNKINFKVFDANNDTFKEEDKETTSVNENGLISIKYPLERADKKYWFIGFYEAEDRKAGLNVLDGPSFLIFLRLESVFEVPADQMRTDTPADLKTIEALNNTDLNNIDFNQFFGELYPKLKINFKNTFKDSSVTGNFIFTSPGPGVPFTTSDKFTYNIEEKGCCEKLCDC